MAKFGVQIDTSRIPIKDLVLDKGTAFPSSPVEGQKFYRTDLHQEFVYTSTGASSGWERCDGVAVIAATTSAAGIVELATTAETTAGTDATRAVTPAGAKALIDALVAAAPGLLDTLDELAAALGDDPNFATTMTNALAGKASTSHTHDLSTASITGVAPITKGGTGGATAQAARTGLLAAGNSPMVNIQSGLTAGVWKTAPHYLGNGTNYPAISAVKFITSDGLPLILDWRMHATDPTKIEIKADVNFAASEVSYTCVGLDVVSNVILP